MKFIMLKDAKMPTLVGILTFISMISATSEIKKNLNHQTGTLLLKKQVHLKTNLSGSKVMKLVSCSTQLSMKFIMLINTKMPTIVDILTFISMISATSDGLKLRKILIFFSILVLYEL